MSNIKRVILKNGQSIAYQIIEPKSASSDEEDTPYLIFLHEGLGCMAMWKDFPHALCNRLKWPGVIYDRQGYGLSNHITKPRTINYLHEYALMELPEIIDLIIPPQKDFFIVGHSDGGSIGLIYASEQNARLKGVITEAAHVFVEPETIRGIEEALKAFEKGALGSLTKYHGEKTEKTFHAWSDTWLSPHFKYWNIEYLLPSIISPVMAIQGVNDQYGTAAQVDTIVNKVSGKSVKTMVKKCGHAPHIQQKNEVLNIMTSFLYESPVF
ncbi:Alpha/beta hydrolase fold protein [Desulfamplus magnetovallimortis]|uniref:Alpha/beta hydrolase fold protein n=1 Tax=Desulfamplus magnetovallimortis TaxID=1246637 RepID=A0A1W1H9G9_9BACT|nr:alpha/beta hydrolase [Desulfamplus magnetovallimortis]SLM29086.1 Alpha/beta hydrolase fold protein [Desulfamplus magnetovallimortis]